jgi:L-alanine-DL-glutamate epimerase-like enolase superfamily enzyme
MWFEDPTPVECFGEIKTTVLLASGERLTTREALLELVRKGAGKVIVDLANIGGPIRFLEIARGLSAMGCNVGIHTFPFHASHLLTCYANCGPVEFLRWWDPLFLNKPAPDTDGNLAQIGPGFGVTADHDFISRNGHIVGTFGT